MKYLKVFTDFRQAMEALADDEKGRLFDAMLQYAETGEDVVLPGNERLVWPGARAGIDRNRANYDKVSAARAEAGSKGGKAAGKAKKRKAIASNSKQLVAIDSNCRQDKDKDKDKDKDNIVSYETNIKGQALQAFCDFRKAIHKPLATKRAEEMLLRKLEKLAPGDDETQAAILEQSIVNGWSGVWPLKQDPGPSGSTTYTNLQALYSKYSQEEASHEQS